MAKNKVLTEKTDINTPFSEFVRKFKKQKTAMVAMVFLVFLVVLAFISYKIAPYGINEYDYSAIMQPPTAAHLFGTDEFGRDLFSRVICGTRISLSVGLFAVTVGMLVGTIMGLLAGYYGGIVDSIIMRICDVLLAFPGLILAIAIVAILGSGLYNVVIAVAVFNIPKFARCAAIRWRQRTACLYRPPATSEPATCASCSSISCPAPYPISSYSTPCPSEPPSSLLPALAS